MNMIDVTTGQRIKKIRAHRGIINSLDRTMAGGAGIELIATGSDDGTVRIWEGGEDGGKQSVAVFEIGCPVTSVCWGADGQNVYIGALDNEIHVRIWYLDTHVYMLNQSLPQVYDVRKNEQVYSLTGHSDTPTSLALSPNGSYLLSPSFSSQTIIHDIRPFSPSPSRIHRVLQGAPAGFENTLLKGAWSKDDDGRRVAVGGADRMVCIWDVESGRVLYKVRHFKSYRVSKRSSAPAASWSQRNCDVR
jgi:Prp8 binding protein